MYVGVFQSAQQMRAQARLQAQAGQLPRVENGRNVTHVAQGVVQGAAQGSAVLLQFGRHAALQPVDLKLGGGQQLADIVMQFTTQALALTFLHLEHARCQFRWAQADRARPMAKVPAHADHRQQLEHQQAG